MTGKKRPKRVSKPKSWKGDLKKRAAEKARQDAADPSKTQTPELYGPAPEAETLSVDSEGGNVLGRMLASDSETETPGEKGTGLLDSAVDELKGDAEEPADPNAVKYNLTGSKAPADEESGVVNLPVSEPDRPIIILPEEEHSVPEKSPATESGFRRMLGKLNVFKHLRKDKSVLKKLEGQLRPDFTGIAGEGTPEPAVESAEASEKEKQADTGITFLGKDGQPVTTLEEVFREPEEAPEEPEKEQVPEPEVPKKPTRKKVVTMGDFFLDLAGEPLYSGISTNEKYAAVLKLASGEKVVIDINNKEFWEEVLEDVDVEAEKNPANEGFRNYIFAVYASAKGAEFKDKEILVYVLSELANAEFEKGEFGRACAYAKRAGQVGKKQLMEKPDAESLHNWSMLEHNVEFYESQLRENIVTAEAE